jgi:hypothetical protein
VVEERNELYFKLVQNALFVNGAGNPPAALVLLEEALRLEPRLALAATVKRQIESSLLTWMSEQRVRTVTKAVEDALQCERAGDAERARHLVQGVLALDPTHAEARGIQDRLSRHASAA